MNIYQPFVLILVVFFISSCQQRNIEDSSMKSDLTKEFISVKKGRDTVLFRYDKIKNKVGDANFINKEIKLNELPWINLDSLLIKSEFQDSYMYMSFLKDTQVIKSTTQNQLKVFFNDELCTVDCGVISITLNFDEKKWVKVLPDIEYLSK